MTYRKLTEKEIAQLETQGCQAQDWNKVEVSTGFSPNYLQRVNVSGNIRLGQFHAVHTFPGGMQKHSGIYNATLHNCVIGDDVLIENVHNYIANYKIGQHTLIQHVGCIRMDERSTFGNGIEVAVLNEAGGKEVKINDHLSSHIAYLLAMYRHHPQLIEKLNAIIETYSQKQVSEEGEIGDYVRIVNASLIRNVRIGNHAQIEGAGRLENGSINSNAHDPVHIGHHVIASDFIISSGAKVEDGTMLTRCFVGQACRLGRAFSAVDSLFFSNCHVENGEAVAVFAGPYTVTHHKSTLLIAGMFSFMNAGSGSNQSNHRYKSGPIHYGIMERGVKTASDSYLLLPAKIGIFSLITGRHYHSPDTAHLPFSYLIEDQGETILIPGINLRTTGTIRDAKKFSERDKRKDPHLLDQINFKLYNPYTIQQINKGLNILNNLKQQQGGNKEFYTYQGCKIPHAALEKGLRLYDLAIQKFLGDVLASQNNCLSPNDEWDLGEWEDLSGILMPKKKIDELIRKIESEELNQLEDIHEFIRDIHSSYLTYEWIWVLNKIQSYYGLSLENPDHSTYVIQKAKEATEILNTWISEDMEKENKLTNYHQTF